MRAPGRFVVAHPRGVIVAWIAAVLLGAALVPRFLDTVQSATYRIPDSDADKVARILRTDGGYSERDVLVVHAAAGRRAVRAALTTIGARLARHDGVARVLGPGGPAPSGAAAISRDGTTGYATVLLGAGVEDRQKLAERLQGVVDDAAPPGVRADLGGTSPLLADMIRVEEHDLTLGEMIGIPIALGILFLTLGSLVAAALPTGLAVGGLVLCLGLLGLVSFFADWSAFVESIVAMLGLGVGIDYGLLFVRRYREERGAGDGDAAALGRTITTAGRTIVFSGATVMVCLPSLLLLREPLYRQVAIAAMLVVGIMVVAAVTLLPAVLLKLGPALDRVPAPRRRAAAGARWAAWARRVMGHAWLYLTVAVALLLTASAPAADLRLGVDYGVRALEGQPSGRALATLARGFGRAALAPVDVVVDGGATARARVLRVLAADRALRDVRVVAERPGRAAIVASPQFAVDGKDAEDLVDGLRARLDRAVPPGARVLVGGTAAESVDYSDRMRDAAPAVIAATLAMSFLLLLWVFRSVLLPVKAILANLLSVGAAYGLLTVVFQNGHGEGVLDFSSPGYLQSYLPITLFVFVFGLSMDYEVFLVSRMREEWLRTGSNSAAVAHGLERTGSVVTSAALIMVAVFTSFMVTATVPEIKQFAFGLGAAVLIDATLVRALVVPAFMQLAGRWNWWMPSALDRLLPGSPRH